MRKKFKLYVWENFACDYTCGIAFAIATSAEEARSLIRNRISPTGMPTAIYENDLAVEPKVFASTDRVAFYVSGGG